jgi:hypothetical protein
MRRVMQVVAQAGLLLAVMANGPCDVNIPISVPVDLGQGDLPNLESDLSHWATMDDLASSSGRQCPCIQNSDCDPGSVCKSGVCESTSASDCSNRNSSCCGGTCGSCAPGGSCVQGMCVPLTACYLGHDPLSCHTDLDCVAAGAVCNPTSGVGLGVCSCKTQNCTPGVDETCNLDPNINAFHGHCTGFGSCECILGSSKDPVTGKCT